MILLLQIRKAIKELIDTLWNVNYTQAFAEAISEAGINRYIMECK